MGHIFFACWVDKIQMEAARITTETTKFCSIQNICNETGWDTLKSRRSKDKLCQLYKLINRLTRKYLQNILLPRAHKLTRYQIHKLTRYQIHKLSRYKIHNNDDFAVPVSRNDAYYKVNSGTDTIGSISSPYTKVNSGTDTV